jgi:hypothetical protein
VFTIDQLRTQPRILTVCIQKRRKFVEDLEAIAAKYVTLFFFFILTAYNRNPAPQQTQ